ncbi:pyridoxamine 5'-phosphate oxidase family protein [Patulibacter defluvii]|uniref:pyridoxamine 5'-phosphate oxidase family protein n=1 Tax=Patulibacter defluvii TaxID=3095358 RepID=UPI002A754948|nr:pyridoxamine 5'-phosphate oxidase family protein [Patulibacter sp. DM4]
MSRRDQITMSEDEVQAFLAEERTVVCATQGPRGWPHLMPLWYVVRDGRLWAWTFAKSQKTKNLERDPRATLQVEAGEQYQELRGVMLETEVVLHHDVDTVTALGAEIFGRYTPGVGDGDLPDELLAMVRKQAVKRVGLEFVEQRRSTWDHRKLAAGVY